MNIEQALALSKELEVSSDSARLDVELLLAEVLGKTKSYLLTWPEQILSEEQERRYLEFLERRKKGEPVAYLLGTEGFWDFQLKVSSSTLIPRADTEVLVEAALDKLADGPYKVADLGTGTGALAFALAKERPSWQVVAVDKITEAVQLAKTNQLALGLTNVQIIQSDWFTQLTGKFAMIVSNPPYIDETDEHLQQGDVVFEPRSALVADEQGYADIKMLTEQAKQYLEAEGWLLFEHGFQQAQEVQHILRSNGYIKIETLKDLAGHPRVTLGCWQGD